MITAQSKKHQWECKTKEKDLDKAQSYAKKFRMSLLNFL